MSRSNSPRKTSVDAALAQSMDQHHQQQLSANNNNNNNNMLVAGRGSRSQTQHPFSTSVTSIPPGTPTTTTSNAAGFLQPPLDKDFLPMFGPTQAEQQRQYMKQQLLAQQLMQGSSTQHPSERPTPRNNNNQSGVVARGSSFSSATPNNHNGGVSKRHGNENSMFQSVCAIN